MIRIQWWQWWWWCKSRISDSSSTLEESHQLSLIWGFNNSTIWLLSGSLFLFKAEKRCTCHISTFDPLLFALFHLEEASIYGIPVIGLIVTKPTHCKHMILTNRKLSWRLRAKTSDLGGHLDWRLISNNLWYSFNTIQPLCIARSAMIAALWSHPKLTSDPLLLQPAWLDFDITLEQWPLPLFFRLYFYRWDIGHVYIVAWC